MIRNDSKLDYSSEWDIDQLLTTNSVSVPSGTSSIYTIPATLPAIPVFHVYFRPSGSAKWYESGAYSTSGAYAALQSFYTYVSGNSISINTTVAGTAKYYVWSDKVNY